MGSIAHAQSYVGTGIVRRIGWGRHQLVQVKLRIFRQMDHLLTGGLLVCHYRLYGIFRTSAQKFTQIFRFCIKKGSYPFPAGQKSDGYLCPGCPLTFSNIMAGPSLVGRITVPPAPTW